MFELFVTGETRIRVLEIRDADDFCLLVKKNRQRLAVWCPWIEEVTGLAATRSFLREKSDRFAAGNGFTAGIFYNDRLAGAIALEYIDRYNRSTEIGYWLDADAEGKGIVTFVCRRLIDYAFGELELERVQIRCASENWRSRAIPEKLGFCNEGTLRHVERLPDRFVDLVIYGMLADEWRISQMDIEEGSRVQGPSPSLT